MTAKDQPEHRFQEIRERIDTGSLATGQIIIIVLCMLLNMSDGFDVISMSVAAPALTEAWGVPRSELGIIFSAALFGMCIGAMFLAPLSDVIGRRKIIIISMCLITLAMFATAYSRNVTQLVLIRGLAGLGIGAILASATSMATEFSPEKYRNFIVTIIVCGYPLGATFVGPIANNIISSHGWETLFLLGGWVNLLLLILSILFIPESIEFIAGQNKPESERLSAVNKLLSKINRQPVSALPEVKDTDNADNQNIMTAIKSLLVPEFRNTTLLLWTIFFCGFMTLYFCMTWIPKLFVESGYSMREGINALTWFNVGGVLGTISMAVITSKIKLNTAIVPMFFITAVLMVIFALFKPTDLSTLNILIFAIGTTLQGAFTCMYAVTARCYPTSIRTTGVGWSIGLGRFGAVVGPAIAGFLTWNMYPLFMLFAIPMVLAAFMITRFDV